ncbi:MAG: ABC transporter ATP-binding protein [Myxococcaceae bacterium]|nr:ABC transporter ATP-binding protein [Myxococcaceae bacterium]
MTTAAIQTIGLSKTYTLGFLMNRRVKALQSLDLTVQPGQIYGVLGPNGAGKSTTLKLLLALVKPTSGRALIFGHPAGSKAGRAEVGFLPENPAPHDYLTGREFVRMCGQLRGLSGVELDREVDQALARVEMTRTAGLAIRRYSKGMVQRVSLAQSLLGKPRLLILDEPSSGLDPVGRRQFRDLVLEEKARGATVMLCTHIIPDVEAICDRVAVLVGGRLVKEGPLSELLVSEAAEVELTLEGVDAEAVRAACPAQAHLTTAAGRVLVRTSAESGTALVGAMLQRGGRLVSYTPVKHSLEQLFLSTLESERGAVGGDLT